MTMVHIVLFESVLSDASFFMKLYTISDLQRWMFKFCLASRVYVMFKLLDLQFSKYLLRVYEVTTEVIEKYLYVEFDFYFTVCVIDFKCFKKLGHI